MDLLPSSVHLCETCGQGMQLTQRSPERGKPGVERRLVTRRMLVVAQAALQHSHSTQGSKSPVQLFGYNVVLLVTCRAECRPDTVCRCAPYLARVLQEQTGPHSLTAVAAPESPSPKTAVRMPVREVAGRFFRSRNFQNRFIVSGTPPCVDTACCEEGVHSDNWCTSRARCH